MSSSSSRVSGAFELLFCQKGLFLVAPRKCTKLFLSQRWFRQPAPNGLSFSQMGFGSCQRWCRLRILWRYRSYASGGQLQPASAFFWVPPRNPAFCAFWLRPWTSGVWSWPFFEAVRFVPLCVFFVFKKSLRQPGANPVVFFYTPFNKVCKARFFTMDGVCINNIRYRFFEFAPTIRTCGSS